MSNVQIVNQMTIKQYFCKVLIFKYLQRCNEVCLNYVQDKLNNRPRKRLDFDSPIEFLTKFGILIKRQ